MWLEFLNYSFMQRALVTAALLSPVCALFGVFVTARKMSFFSDTVGHGALAGVALGLLLGVGNPLISLVGISVAIAWLIFIIKEKTELVTDTIMAILFSGLVAVAILIFSYLKGFRGELHRYLFGDILSVGKTEVALAAVILLVVGAIFFKYLSEFCLVTINEELSHARGVNVKWINYIFVTALAIVVAMSVRLLGIILVTSWLVIPAAAARNVAKNLRQQLIFSVAFGVGSGILGTVASYYIDCPSGPCISLTCIAIFMLTLLWKIAKRT
ncbi:MAG: metal ABC transporter permease [Verrucomicrobiae bacterium]|nr:metal ABC transporter permease [Verrucomicrobiae bacterium]